MKPDELGFLYPQIDEKSCINCNLCRNVCKFPKNEICENKDELKVYAVKNKHVDIHEKSSSGGVFIPLSDAIIKRGGVVYGAGYSNDFKIIHRKAQTYTERDELVGSKYVQSDMNTCISQVEKDLKKGKYVLFSGTACQVHGLQSYLDRRNCNKDKLITIDIVCHGVPSPKMWEDFLERIKKNGEIQTISFTSKKIKNELKGLRCTFTDGKELLTGFYWTTFGKMFMNNFNLRESCYRCPYTSPTNRYADITLGDFWGLEKSLPDFTDSKGVSLVLVHTKKGMEYFEEIKNEIIYKESNIESCLQPNLIEPSKRPDIRQRISSIYAKKGYMKTYYLCFRTSVKEKIKRVLKKELV
jgi:coenzyme F420-reducing hydrogenase beta subunit